MIHSLSGGMLSSHTRHDYAKVLLLDCERQNETLWVVSEIPLLKQGDIVAVQNSNYGQDTGRVLRVDKEVDEFSFPIPYKRMKKIIKIIDENNK